MAAHPKRVGRQASRPLVDVIGEMTDEQAVAVLAIFNRHLHSKQEAYPAATSDAA
jgi:hypothetical protein